MPESVGLLGPSLGLSAILFSLGVAGVVLRRNAIILFVCIELMLNAVNLSFVALAQLHGPDHAMLEIERLEHDGRLAGYRYLPMIKAEFLQRLGRTADADELAMHLLARSQGVATLANAFRDGGFVDREVDAMCEWLDALTGEA